MPNGVDPQKFRLGGLSERIPQLGGFQISHGQLRPYAQGIWRILFLNLVTQLPLLGTGWYFVERLCHRSNTSVDLGLPASHPSRDNEHTRLRLFLEYHGQNKVITIRGSSRNKVTL
jgi:hypothetical protein